MAWIDSRHHEGARIADGDYVPIHLEGHIHFLRVRVERGFHPAEDATACGLAMPVDWETRVRANYNSYPIWGIVDCEQCLAACRAASAE